jgi:hypothetical protein
MKSLVLRSIFCLFALTVPLAQRAFSQEVIPILRCVRYDRNDNRLTTYWGYSSTFQSPLHLDIGVNNFFSPGAIFRNQPTDFQPGVHENIFTTSFQVSSSLPQITWVLNGRTATAGLDTNLACDPPPNLGQWDTERSYGSYVSVSHNSVLWVSPFHVDPAQRGEPGVDPFWSPLLLRGAQGPKGDTGEKGDRGDRGETGQSVIGQAEPPGSNCTYGGVKYTDVESIRFVCNGAPGPQGPPGNPNVFPSAQAYTIPRGATLTVLDSHVTASSVITLQYVGGDLLPPVAINIQSGRFTAVGIPNRQFRYVIVNSN